MALADTHASAQVEWCLSFVYSTVASQWKRLMNYDFQLRFYTAIDALMSLANSLKG
jgi:hypothetical protein